MDKNFVTTMLNIYAMDAIDTFGPNAIVVLNGGEPGVYENNPTIMEFEQKGYRLCDANMFGVGLDERYEALTFCKKTTE